MFFFKWFVITALLMLLGCIPESAIFFGFIGAIIESVFESED